MMTHNATAATPTDRLSRIIRLQRLAFAGLSGLAVLAVGLGFGLAAGDPAEVPSLAPEITHYTASDDRLYRIWDNGDIHYLIADFANGSVKGIPSWTRIQIDDSLTRDRMGNMIRVPGR